jgi:protein unc-13
MYRTMFPTGNITDALSYYPTSTRYESTPSVNQPRTDYNHGSMWLSSSQASIDTSIANQLKHDHTSASSRSVDSASAPNTECGYISSHYMDSRRYAQHPPQQHYVSQSGLERGGEQDESYPREYSWGQRPDIQYLELDLRKRNTPDHHQQQLHDGQYYDPSGVIVSQSGYISISADIKDSNYPQDEKVSKKGKLKSAMSSVSSWLPGLHLSKRHRSHSLPAGVRREDLVLSKEHERGYMTPRGKSQLHSTTTLPRKKKKNPLASTMSGILQKAKRRSHHSQSLSDPEQSETEWSGRQSGFSEDSEDSVFSDVPSDTNVFAKVSHAMPRQHSLQQQQIQTNTRMGPRRDSDMDQVNELPYDTEPAQANPLVEADPSSLFPTVGEVKRAATQSKADSEETGNEKLQFPPVTVGGASREFAVSRALGKYRLRQSSSMSADEQMGQEDTSSTKTSDQVPIIATTDEDVQEDIYDEPSIETIIDEAERISTPQQPSRPEEPPNIETSPSVSSMRSYTSGRHHATRHQQSLEIPWSGTRGEGDEDSRSTHSWRSTSRVSSRRQSTEDSIDSEDEWYCYELRKLEEMERQQDSEPLQGDKTECFEPDEEVKEQMSFVLQELKLKAKTREGVLDEEDYNHQVRTRATGSIMQWEEVQNDLGDKHTEPFPVFSEQASHSPMTEEPKKKSSLRLRDDEESSSGETSGPDSPHQSMDEMEVDEEEEAAMEAELTRSVRSSSGSTLRHGDKPLLGSDSLSREGSVSVPPSEMSISIPVSDGWDSEETATVREGSVSVPASDVWELEVEGEYEALSDLREGAESSTPSMLKFKIDSGNSSANKDDAATKDSGPMGSKWKLLKALKERKAEEKIQEAATATAAAEAKSLATTVGKLRELNITS